ncbi:MAG: GNAT family N-acetyltransferase [Myxococcales bacterium]|nr:GNAT family N-acetyltransferase [Myxococcales bacterium]
MSEPADLMDFHEYPKTVTIGDGQKVTLRPMRADDRDRLFAFFKRIPAEERRAFKHDVSQREVITNWCRALDYDRVLPILALSGEGDKERVVADGTLHTERHGWDTHVARLRLTVDPELRKRGLGQVMLRELYHRASLRGIEKVQVEVRADNAHAISLLQKLGYKQEAVFVHHALDLEGKKHDVIIFYNDMNELWQKMADLNIDSDFFLIP